jgi:hypothetical protein
MQPKVYELQEYYGYGVSDDGRIWSRKCYGIGNRLSEEWHEIKPRTDHKGYHQITLRINGKQISRLVSRLVYVGIKGAIPDGMEVCHDDGDKLNNAIANLRLDTHQGNAMDMFRHGTMRVAKLNETQVLDIRARLAQGETSTVLMHEYGVTRDTIIKIKNRRTWGHI